MELDLPSIIDIKYDIHKEYEDPAKIIEDLEKVVQAIRALENECDRKKNE